MRKLKAESLRDLPRVRQLLMQRWDLIAALCDSKHAPCGNLMGLGGYILAIGCTAAAPGF